MNLDSSSSLWLLQSSCWWCGNNDNQIIYPCNNDRCREKDHPSKHSSWKFSSVNTASWNSEHVFFESSLSITFYYEKLIIIWNTYWNIYPVSHQVISKHIVLYTHLHLKVHANIRPNEPCFPIILQGYLVFVVPPERNLLLWSRSSHRRPLYHVNSLEFKYFLIFCFL